MDDDNAPWQYKPDDKAASVPDEPDNPAEPVRQHRARPELSWEAAEFIEHPHGSGWYGGLIVITVALAAVIFLATRDFFATGVIVVVGVIVWVFAGHKPSRVQYAISASGLSINGKNYSLSSYKSFSVMREGELSSVNLIPLKRFMPPLAAYFDPKDEDKITEALGEYLPLEDRRMDTIDKISRRLRL